MNRRLISILIISAMTLSPFGAFAADADAQKDPDVLHEIFGALDSVSPDEYADRLPYTDGTVLSDVREPLYLSGGNRKIFGENNLSSENPAWKTESGAMRLGTGKFTLGSKTYTLSGTYKFLAAYEGDFDNDGRRGELALLAAAKTSDGKSHLFLCTADARGTSAAPVAVLYDGSTAAADFYADTADFINCMSVVCADINGDGFDEIITTTPTGGYTSKSSDKYGFDKFAGSYAWSLKTDGRTENSWKSADGWTAKPETLGNSMYTGVENCHLGAPGVTASVSAADVDGDGYDDIVSAISSTNARYNANYVSNMYSIYYIGGAPTVPEMYLKRKPLVNYMPSAVKDKMYLDATTGDASGFGTAICDIDNSGKPTVFLSLKHTSHRWAAYSGAKMYTPEYFVLAFDYNSANGSFVSSTVYNGGIYHNGWVDGSDRGDTEYVYKTKVSDCAPVRIGILKGDFGLSDGKHGFVSSGTLIVDQKYIPFVRYPNGSTYRYDAKDIGSYTGNWGTDSPTVADFSGTDCIFYNNGITVTDIRTANVSFDGDTYTDAALVRAYTESGFSTYFLTASGSGYTAYPSSAVLDSGAEYSTVSMPDTDSDSIYLKYDKHQFFWADPVIIAALASPPYFGSLPSDTYTNSQTAYGRSTSSAVGKTESFSVSAGAYVSAEIKAGALGTAGVFESESEALKSSTLGDENMKQVSYTQSFSTSGGEDTVVMTTIAYDAYAYTAYYAGEGGKIMKSPYIVYVPRGGTDAIKTASLSLEDYQSFIPYSNGALPSLDDVFSHTVGKPETYPHTEPSGGHILKNSTITYPRTSSFPTNTGSQTMTIDISEETTKTTASGSSVSAKLGGGVEAEADDIFGMANTGSKITVGSVTEREYESGKITTNAVGTSFEGTIFGQGDGANPSGSTEKAAFNWKLLHYIYDIKDGDAVQQFPVVTYITSGVNQPKGVVPSKLTVSPDTYSISQVGAATPNYTSTASFSVTAEGVTREAYTALEGAPLGMSLNTGGTNIGTSAPFPFGVSINGNVAPGSYTLRLNVGGVLSNPFTVTVTPYEMPHWLAADKTELDFGKNRANIRAAEQTVTVRNLHNSALQGLTATLGENSPFEITTPLSVSTIAEKGSEGDAVTIGIRPKTNLDVGPHTDTLTVTNGVAAAFVTLTYTVAEPTIPEPPNFKYSLTQRPNPIYISVNAPSDNGGARISKYLYTLKGHENYLSDGEQVWKSYSSDSSSFELPIPEELTIGETYTLGVKAVNVCGESSPAWFDFTVCRAEDDPDPAQNIRIYPSNGAITVTWDAPNSWGENEYVSDILWKYYQLFLTKPDRTIDYAYIEEKADLQHTFTGLENGVSYSIELYTRTTNRSNYTFMTASPSAQPSVPSRPKNFKAEMSYKTAHLIWEAPGTDGNAAISGYKISKDGGKTYIEIGNTNEYTFTDLVTNSEYDFAVCAVNSAGDGGLAVTHETAPHKLAAPEINSVVEGYAQLELDWYPSSADGVTGYEVRLDDGEWTDAAPTLYDGTLHYIFTGLENERKYTVSVRAKDGEGGGAAARRINRTPRSIAPKAVTNPRLEPLNGGFRLYGDAEDGNYPPKYKIDGDRYWFTYYNGTKLLGLENGKEYTVAISSESRDENGFTLRTVQYLTVTPDASIPDDPSAPEIKAFVGEDYVRLTWEVEDDGGAPITQYNIDFGDGTSITLPSDENSFVMSCTADERANYSHITVTAVNRIGSSGSQIYLDPRTNMEGTDEITLPVGHGEVKSGEYKLIAKYPMQDDDGNDIWEIDDVSGYAEWSFTSPHSVIVWDSTAHRIVIGGDLPNGEYEAVVYAKSPYSDVTFERKVKIIAGDTTEILSAGKTLGGISAQLNISDAVGTAVLCTAAYDASGKLVNAATQTVTAQTASSGEIFVPIELSSAKTVKVMLLRDLKSARPLCESKFAE